MSPPAPPTSPGATVPRRPGFREGEAEAAENQGLAWFLMAGSVLLWEERGPPVPGQDREDCLQEGSQSSLREK